MKDLACCFDTITNILLTYDKPSIYFEKHINDEIFTVYPFSILKKIKDIDQNSKTHKEGNVFIHTMLAIDIASSLRDFVEDKKVFMWSVLLHDIGKIPTSKVVDGKITAYEHHTYGANMVLDFFKALNINDEIFVNKVYHNVRCHMYPSFIVNEKYNYLEALEDEYIINNYEILAKIFICDRLGRGEPNKEKTLYKEKKFKEKMENKKLEMVRKCL